MTTIWRTDQLKDAVVVSLNKRSLIAAASAARALFETSCAFYVESNSIISDVSDAKKEGVHDAADATKLRVRLQRKAIGTALGTRQKQILKEHEGLTRTNIMTLIDKALKSLNLPEHMGYYEKLCDAVHPSAESFLAFNVELGQLADDSQQRYIMKTGNVNKCAVEKDPKNETAYFWIF